MCAHRVDIAKKGGILSTVFELFFGVCSSNLELPIIYWTIMHATHSQEIHILFAFENQKIRRGIDGDLQLHCGAVTSAPLPMPSIPLLVDDGRDVEAQFPT